MRAGEKSRFFLVWIGHLWTEGGLGSEVRGSGGQWQLTDCSPLFFTPKKRAHDTPQKGMGEKKLRHLGTLVQIRPVMSYTKLHTDTRYM